MKRQLPTLGAIQSLTVDLFPMLGAIIKGEPLSTIRKNFVYAQYIVAYMVDSCVSDVLGPATYGQTKESWFKAT